jgi:two-component system, NarL family, sensor histidine kinase UhpB
LDIKPTKILLVEDSTSDAMLMEEMLSNVEDFPHSVQHVESLKQSKEQLEGTKYDAVILDLSLPDSTGLKTYTTMRSMAPDTPIIIMTGNDDRTQLVEAMNSGADNYLIKDKVDGSRIAIAILSAIRNRI